jgi:hypothetical protein
MAVDTWKPTVFLGTGILGLNSVSISIKPFWRDYIAEVL